MDSPVKFRGPVSSKDLNFEEYFLCPHREVPLADFTEYEKELDEIFDILDNELSEHNISDAEQILNKHDNKDVDSVSLRLLISSPIKPKKLKNNNNKTLQSSINILANKAENIYKIQSTTLTTKLAMLPSSKEPLNEERMHLFTQMSYILPIQSLWKEYKSRRENDLNSIIKEYSESPNYISICLKYMEIFISMDYEVIVDSENKYNFNFKCLGTPIGLLQELYLDNYSTLVDDFVVRKPNLLLFSNPINIISKYVQQIHTNFVVFILDNRTDYIWRMASIVHVKPCSITLTYQGDPSLVTVNRLCYIKRTIIKKEDLQPFMNIMFPNDIDKGYYQCGIVLVPNNNDENNSTTVLYRDCCCLKEMKIVLGDEICLGCDMYGCSDSWNQISSYAILMEHYFNHIISLCNKTEYKVDVSELRFRAFAFPLNSCNTLVKKELSCEWNTILQIINETESVEYWSKSMEIVGTMNSNKKYYILPIIYELLGIIKQLTISVRTSLFGTIDYLGKELIGGIRVLFHSFYDTLIDKTHEGLENTLFALSSLIYLVDENIMTDLIKSICDSYYYDMNSTGKNKYITFHKELHTFGIEVDSYIKDYVDQIIRNQITLFQDTVFCDITMQNWNFHKYFYDNKRVSFGIDFWKLQLNNVIKNCNKYIGNFTTDAFSHYIIRNIIYQSLLQFEVHYSIIKPSRARLNLYKMDVLTIITIVLYYMNLLHVNLNNNNDNNLTRSSLSVDIPYFEKNSYESINRMICRLILYSNPASDIVDYLKYCFNNGIDDTKPIFEINKSNTYENAISILNVILTRKENFEIPDDKLREISMKYTTLTLEDLMKVKFDWKIYLCPNSLSSQETFEIINNRQDLSEETYPPITDEEKEAANLIRKNLDIFQSLFIKEECESPTHSRQQFLFNEENAEQQHPTDSQNDNNAQQQQQQQQNENEKNNSEDDEDSDNEEEIKDENQQTPLRQEENKEKQEEQQNNVTLTPNIKPKLEPLQPRSVPIIADDGNTDANKGLTKNKLNLAPPRRLYKKHDEAPKPSLNPELLLTPPASKQKSVNENENENENENQD